MKKKTKTKKKLTPEEIDRRNFDLVIEMGEAMNDPNLAYTKKWLYGHFITMEDGSKKPLGDCVSADIKWMFTSGRREAKRQAARDNPSEFN